MPPQVKTQSLELDHVRLELIFCFWLLVELMKFGVRLCMVFAVNGINNKCVDKHDDQLLLLHAYDKMHVFLSRDCM